MPLGQPAVGAPPFQRPAGGPLIRSLQAPQKGGLLSLWWPMADDPSALLLANILRMPGGPLQQMLVEQGFPSLSGTVEVWLARSARTLLVEVQAKEQPTLGRHELLKYLRNLAGALPETSIIEAAQRQLLMHYQENMQDGRWVCEQLVDCVVRRDEWILHEAAISGAASFLQQRWVSLLDLSRGLITCAWPEQARRQSLAWPAACPQDNVTSLDKKAIVGSGNLLFLETTPSVPNRVKMTNGATLLVHRSHVPRFTLTVGFINGGDALPAVLAAGGGEGWNRLVRALAIRSLSLRSGCTPDYAWLQMTGPTDQFGVGLEYLIRIVDTSPDCRFAQIAEAWPEQPQGQYKNNLILSPPLRLMAEIFPNYQYRNIPNQLITWERMLHCWNDSFIGCQSVWAITGDVTDRDVTSMAKEIETLRHGEIIRGEQAFLTKPQKKLILVNASSSAAFIAWSLPPEASNIGDLEILRWLLSGYLFRTLRAGHPGIYRGGALYRIWQDGSAFGLYALARPWHVLTCLRKMQSTVAQIHAEGFDTQKVAAAKAALSAAEDELCANQDAWGLELIAREVSSGPLELATIRYQKSSPSTIQYSLQQYLQLEEAVTLVIWPGWHKILKTLSNSINLKLHLEKFKSS
jgi:hypothetical protein